MINSEDARHLLSILRNKRSAPKVEYYLKEFTVGDKFRSTLRAFHYEITNHIGHMPRIIRGTPGVGKTHFLRTLHLSLESIPDKDDTLVIWIDMRQLTNPQDLQYLFIKGLALVEDIEGNGNYQSVLQTVYKRIDTRIRQENIGNNDRITVVRTVLSGLLDFASNFNPFIKIGDWITSRAFDDVKYRQEKRRIEQQRRISIGDELQSPENIIFLDYFIDEFIKLGEGEVHNFDSMIKNLSYQSRFDELVDLYMRILKFAGYTRIVMFIDEMELIDSETLIETEYILNIFFRLHEMLGDNAYKWYPSIVQIMAMPNDLLADTIRKSDGALYTRWSETDFPITMLSKNNLAVNELVHKLHKLYNLAGYDLGINTNDPKHMEYIKNAIYKKLATRSNDEDKFPTTRNIIRETILFFDAINRNKSG